MYSILQLVSTVITLYIWALIISAVMSWLVAFNVINTQNRFVYMVGDFLYRITEPVLRPIRRFIRSVLQAFRRIRLPSKSSPPNLISPANSLSPRFAITLSLYSPAFSTTPPNNTLPDPHGLKGRAGSSNVH